MLDRLVGTVIYRVRMLNWWMRFMSRRFLVCSMRSCGVARFRAMRICACWMC